MLYKRPDSPYWWVRVTPPGGKSLRVSAQTTDKRVAARLEAQLRSGARPVGERQTPLWEDAVVRFLKEKGAGYGRPWRDAIPKLRNLSRHFAGIPIDEITDPMLVSYSAWRRHKGAKPATVNRDLEVVRAILLKAARDWKILTNPPVVRKLTEPKRRVRFLSREDAQRLLTELPAYLRPAVQFSLSTGLRKSNVLGLQWSQVDLVRGCAWIHADQAKNAQALAVPLNQAAVRVLQGEVGNHPEFVFSRDGQRIRQVSNQGWHEACARAGIGDFRWHDLRHTWASWHVQAGTPLSALQELGGWSSYEMVRRYAAFGAGHLASYAENSGL